MVQCECTELGVQIGEQVFYHNAADMVIPVAGSDGVFLSAVQTSLRIVAFPVLGTAFLKNVVAVFDVGRSEMTFMSRVYYDDS